MNKKVQYETVIKNLELILDSERPLSVNAKMSIIASALHTTFSHWTFCGFYVICKPDLLEIGPYQGHVLPCIHIPFGQGVCGEVASTGKSKIVEDVLLYPNYISCDSKTRSEIVIPLFQNQKVIAVLDMDSPDVGDIEPIDQCSLERISDFI